MRKAARRLFRLALLPALAACTLPPPVTTAEMEATDYDAGFAKCCGESPDLSPTQLVLLEETLNVATPVARAIKLRPSWLEDRPAAQAALLEGAEPLDIVMIANFSRLTATFGSGFFGHSAVYVGDEAQLRALGVWDHPAVARHHARIRAGAVAIESIDHGVRLSPRNQLLEADAAALLHSRGLSRARKQQAVIDLFDALGHPFDDRLDLDDDSAYYCTELIYRTLPELNLPVRISYDRRAVWPDEVVLAALRGTAKLDFVRYVRGRRAGWALESRERMLAEIFRSWPLE